MQPCQYERIKCDEEAYAEGVTQCIYHDKNYLKDDKYDKNKDKVAEAFYGRVNFILATFSERAYFSNATFTKEADFSRAIFTKEVAFIDTTFSEGASFFDTTFTKEADFSNATFTKEANFVRTRFHDTWFSQAKFLNEVRFSESELFEGETIFRYTIFEQPSKVLFDVEDLSKVSFAGTDISEVTFTDKVKWGGKDCLKIIEEEWIETGNRIVSFGLVLYVYRRLRENYEFNLKFDVAGKFFIKEMELKRKYRTIHLENPRYEGSNELVKCCTS